MSNEKMRMSHPMSVSLIGYRHDACSTCEVMLIISAHCKINVAGASGHAVSDEVLDHLDTDIMCSNAAEGMDVRLRLSALCWPA
jgi:hypothetical protein